MTERQNIPTLQLPPAKWTERKTHLYLLCNGGKQMEKNSQAGIKKNQPTNNKTHKKPKPKHHHQKTHSVFPRDSLELKFFSSRTGPGPQLRVIWSITDISPVWLCTWVSQKLGCSEPGFGSGHPDHRVPFWPHTPGESLCSATTPLLQRASNYSPFPIYNCCKRRCKNQPG